MWEKKGNTDSDESDYDDSDQNLESYDRFTGGFNMSQFSNDT